MIQTYLQNRKCRHCNTPIADRQHKLQKFCPKETFPDGSVKNCKDEYWSQIRREEFSPFVAMAYFQRDQFNAIDLLFKSKGEKVSLEDINRFGINLFRPVELNNEGGQYTLYFHFYGISQLPNNEFKIFTHALY
jgi:hypothetical protein